MTDYNNYSKAALIKMLENKESQRKYAWFKYYELRNDSYYNRFIGLFSNIDQPQPHYNSSTIK